MVNSNRKFPKNKNTEVNVLNFKNVLESYDIIETKKKRRTLNIIIGVWM